MTDKVMKCTVCDSVRASLRPRKSKLIPTMPMWVCNSCIEKKYEPRFAVILVARDPDQGLPQVRDYIRHHRYAGNKILAEELT